MLYELKVISEFGNWSKHDFKQQMSWKEIYEYLRQLVNVNLPTPPQNPLIISNSPVEKMKKSLIRKANKATIIPIVLNSKNRDPNDVDLSKSLMESEISKLLLIPKHGDVVLDIDISGYRNHGLWFYHETKGLINDIEPIEDGIIPFDFSWPKFHHLYYSDVMEYAPNLPYDLTNYNFPNVIEQLNKNIKGNRTYAFINGMKYFFKPSSRYDSNERPVSYFLSQLSASQHNCSIKMDYEDDENSKDTIYLWDLESDY